MRGGLDAQGNLVAYDFEARAADHNHLGYNEHDTVLIAQLAGMRKATPNRGGASTPSDMYAIPNRRMATHVVGLPLVWETPLRTGNLRDPNGPQVTFASESFIDELAAAAGADPVAFRMKLLTASTNDDSGFKRARSIAVLKAAADAYGWDARVSPKPIGRGEILTGRGIAYTYRNQTVVAEIAEVEVNRRTGHVWVKRLVCAHDCGLVVNPSGVRGTIECGMLHSLSRALHEEVSFDTEKVTSVDWAHVSDAHARRRARADRHRARQRRSQSAIVPICPCTVPARRSASRSSRPSPMPFSTRRACASGACRSGPAACSPHSRQRRCDLIYVSKWTLTCGYSRSTTRWRGFSHGKQRRGSPPRLSEGLTPLLPP